MPVGRESDLLRLEKELLSNHKAYNGCPGVNMSCDSLSASAEGSVFVNQFVESIEIGSLIQTLSPLFAASTSRRFGHPISTRFPM